MTTQREVGHLGNGWGTTFPQHGGGGGSCPWAKVPKETTAAPQGEARLKGPKPGGDARLPKDLGAQGEEPWEAQVCSEGPGPLAWEWAGTAACRGPVLGSGDASTGAERPSAESVSRSSLQYASHRGRSLASQRLELFHHQKPRERQEQAETDGSQGGAQGAGEAR